MILLVGLEVLGQMGDPLREERYLDLGRPRIGVVGLVLVDGDSLIGHRVLRLPVIVAGGRSRMNPDLHHACAAINGDPATSPNGPFDDSGGEATMRRTRSDEVSDGFELRRVGNDKSLTPLGTSRRKHHRVSGRTSCSFDEFTRTEMQHLVTRLHSGVRRCGGVRSTLDPRTANRDRCAAVDGVSTVGILDVRRFVLPERNAGE